MTCRDEVLKAAAFLSKSSLDSTFSPADIVNRMQKMGTDYSESTIRTHVVSKMCIGTPINHACKHDDLERVSRGVYRLR